MAFDLLVDVRSVALYPIPRDFTCRSTAVSANLRRAYVLFRSVRVGWLADAV